MASFGGRMFLHVILLISFIGITVSQDDTNPASDETDMSYMVTYGDANDPISDIDVNDPESIGDVNNPINAIEAADVNDMNSNIDVNDPEASGDVNDPNSDIDINDGIEATDDGESVNDIAVNDMPETADKGSTSDIDINEDIEETGDNNDSNIGDIQTEDENLNIHGISKNKMKDFCSQIVEGSEPTDTHTCRHVKCEKDGDLTGVHVFNYNICPSGKYCADGECTSTEPESPAAALTDEEFDIVNEQCKKELGPGFAPYCSVSNIGTHPDIISGCKNDLCDALLCAGWEEDRWRFTWAYLDEGSKCGNGKTCKDKQCQ